jgi:aconitate hydratase
VVELNLASVEPSLAGPRRPQDRVPLRAAKAVYQAARQKMAEERAHKNPQAVGHAGATVAGRHFEVKDGAVLIAAITSCTNTSNPAVLIAAGLLARNAHRKGLATQPWVKTSLSPGSRVVTDYLNRAGLTGDLEALGFYTAGYGCQTCIGNSGPLKEEISNAVKVRATSSPAPSCRAIVTLKVACIRK